MPKYKRAILVPLGDKQAGHSGALVNPETELPIWEFDSADKKFVQNGTENPTLSPMQKQLWKWHEQDRKKVADLAGKDPIIYLGMGDETQGGIFKEDLQTVSLAKQWLYSKYNMQPWLDMPQVKAAYFAQGTSVHLWGAGDSETVLVHHLKEMYPKKRIELTQHWELELNGKLIDVAHHGPGVGLREWTKGNTLRLYTKSLMQKLHDNRKQTPDLLLRAHYHQPITETVTLNLDEEILKCEAWITPPYCIIGSHGQKATQSVSQMHVGFLAFEIIEGLPIKTHYKPFWHTFDLRVKERIEL